MHSIGFDDLELLSSNFRRVSRDFANAATAKRMKIDPYCQRQRCNPLNILFIASICRRFLRQGPSYTHFCRTLAAYLSDSLGFLSYYKFDFKPVPLLMFASARLEPLIRLHCGV